MIATTTSDRNSSNLTISTSGSYSRSSRLKPKTIATRSRLRPLNCPTIATWICLARTTAALQNNPISTPCFTNLIPQIEPTATRDRDAKNTNHDRNAEWQTQLNRTTVLGKSILLDLEYTMEDFIEDSVCVDAACSSNPGPVEYRGLRTSTKEVLFHIKLEHGTNNLGEFLAVVHALAYLQKIGDGSPVYSDSQTAIAWVENRQVRTTLEVNSDSQKVLELTERALKWLKANRRHNLVLKWETRDWGEIPADFGRKRQRKKQPGVNYAEDRRDLTTTTRS